MGDPAGIGPEITEKAWNALKHDAANAFFVIGSPELYPNAAPITSPNDAAVIFGNRLPVLPIECPKPTIGLPSKEAADAITGSIETAVSLSLSGRAGGVVTNPISKHVLYQAGFEHPGHTEYLGVLTDQETPPYPRGPLMMLAAKGLRVALVTIHMPLARVPDTLSIEIIIEKAKTLHGALKTDFGINAPRIVLCGLNPHAGEDGALGTEEIDIINPAAGQLRAMGIDITDAQSADTLFHEDAREGYDAVLAMYHDQGLIPVKTLDFHGGINTTLGLPIIRTSPDHGTAFDIAGQGIARPDSLIAAIKAAREMTRCRYG